MLDLKRMCENICSAIAEDAPTTNPRFTYSYLTDIINAEYRKVLNTLLHYPDTEFMVRWQDFVADASAPYYSYFYVPTRFVQLLKIYYLSADGNKIETKQWRTEQATHLDNTGEYYYWLMGNRIYFPTTGTYRIIYKEKPPSLHFGTMQFIEEDPLTNSQIRFASVATGGAVVSEDDYYDGADVHIISGTGAGQTRRITAYAGSTKVATVNPAWTLAPAETSIYCIYPVIPEINEDVIYFGAIVRIKDNTVAQLYLQDYYDAYKQFTDTLKLRDANATRGLFKGVDTEDRTVEFF